MVREIRGNEITSNFDKYYLEKAIEAARKRRSDSDIQGPSNEVVDGRSCDCTEMGRRTNGRASSKRYVFAAITVEGRGRRQATGYNSYTKTHPKQKWYSIRNGESPDRCYTHAEIHAISKLHGADAIYIARVDNRGNTNLAKPCRACRAAIEDSGIKKVVYT